MFFKECYEAKPTVSVWFFAFFSLLLIGIFFSSLIPPFQSPDEQDHLKRAYFLSKGRIAMQTPEGQSTGGMIDTGLINYMAQFHYIAGNQQKKLTADVQRKAAEIRWTGDEQFGPSPGVNYYFPIIYLPQAFGLTVGQALDLTVSQSYYLARFCGFICSLIVIFIAFSIQRPSLFVVAILVMPLTVFQLVSTSQDGFATALVVLSGSLFLRITSAKDEFNSILFSLMCAAILLLTTSRINLMPMLLLPFIASYISFKNFKYYAVSGGVTVLSLCWILYAVLTTVDLRVDTGASTTTIALFYLQNPISFLAVLINTLKDAQTLNFYIGSFIGVLGWLDTRIDDLSITTIFYCLIFIFVFSVSSKALKENKLQCISLVLVAVASILLVFFLLLVTWNEHPAEVIQGVQGRYLWAPIILLGFALTTQMTGFSLPRKILIVMPLLIVVGITVSVTPQVLLTRYFVQSTQAPSIAPIDLKVRDIVIEPLAGDVAEIGGFIDASEFKRDEIILTGWGYFNKDEKLFFSNKVEEIRASYITVERPDVVNAMDDATFIYAGFELRIPAENLQEAKNIMAEFCLYSNQSPFGIRQLSSGSANKLYKCGRKTE